MSDTATDGSSTQSKTDVPDQSVQGELDALINEGATQQQPDLVKKVDRVVNYIDRQEAQVHNENFRADMDAAVKAVQEVIPEEAQKFLTAELIEGQLYKRAEDDKAVKKAFLERHSDPAAWQEAQKTIVGDFAKQFKEAPDKEVNEDREAVMAAAKPSGRSDEGEEMTFEQVETMRIAEPAKWQELQKKHGVKPYGV